MPRRSFLAPASVAASVAVMALLLLLLLLSPAAVTADHDLPTPAQTFRSNFEDKTVASVQSPTDLYFTPDGQYAYVTSKFGTVWRVSVADMDRNNGVAEKVFEVPHPMCLNGARGLGGVAVHPDYPAKRYIYLFHNHDKYDDCSVDFAEDAGPVNRMSRWTLNADLRSVDPNSEVVFFETSRLGTQTHNSGDIEFGADGKVYVTVGESGSKKHKNNKGEYYPLARNVLLGSVVRFNDDGSIPSDNPFVSSNNNYGGKSARCGLTGGMHADATTACSEIYATGFRNPFRFAMDPNAYKRGQTRFFVNDVGSNTWEMVKELGDPTMPGMAGRNFGYPLREGPCEGGQDTNCYVDKDYDLPTYYYHHISEHGGAITGGTFVPDDAGWPAEMRDGYLYAEYAWGGIYLITPDESEQCDFPKCDPPRPPFKQQIFNQNKKVVGLQFGPHKGGTQKAMYYLVHLPSGRDGEGINRISFTGDGNRDPKAVISASDTVGFLPLTVTFDGTGSTDPDNGDTANLSYEWDLDDDGRVDSTDAKPTFKFTKPGVFNAKLIVRDGKGGMDSTTIRIDVDNSPPGPKILSPFPGTTFAVGDVLTLRGEAVDAEDGKLSDAQLTWEVRQHHNNHYHPFLDPTVGNNIVIDPAPPPEDFFEYTTTRSYLSVHLTATDSSGLSSTTVVEVHPRMVDLTFDSEPSGMTVLLNAEKFTTPVSMVGWEGHTFEIEAPLQPPPGGRGGNLSLNRWSEGVETGALTADYTVPAVQPTQPIVAIFHPSRPIPTIKGIDKDLVFSVGDSFELKGSALAADGISKLSDSALTWEVRLYNVDADDYVTLLPPTKGNGIAMPPIPAAAGVVFNHNNGRDYGRDAAEYNSPDAAGLGYLEIRLTATDAASGRSDTISQIIEPDVVEVQLDTEPSGLEVRVDGEMVTTPVTVSAWRDHQFNVKAFGGYKGDTKYQFSEWSSGQSRSHTVRARSDQTVVATMKAVDSIPRPEISGYKEGRQTFKVGEEFVLTGTGVDRAGKELPYYALSWSVNLYSKGTDGGMMAHRRIAGEKGRDIYFEIPEPESIAESETGFIEVVLTAKDEKEGMKSTRTMIMQPSHVDVRFESEPTGLYVMANGEQIQTPTTLTLWRKQTIELDSPGSQKKKGDVYNWWSWSDEHGNEVYSQAHTYIVPRATESRIVMATFGVGPSPFASAKADSSGGASVGIVVACLVVVVLALGVVGYLLYRKKRGIEIVDVSADVDRSFGDEDFKSKPVDVTHETDGSIDESFERLRQKDDLEASHGQSSLADVISGIKNHTSRIFDDVASSVFGSEAGAGEASTIADNRDAAAVPSESPDSIASLDSDDPYHSAVMSAGVSRHYDSIPSHPEPAEDDDGSSVLQSPQTPALSDYLAGDIQLDTASDTTSIVTDRALQ